MYALLERTRPVVVGPPSALLRHLAGDFAPRIAGLWPQPHTPFLTSGADRRHLVCIALVLVGSDLNLLEPYVLLDASLSDALASFMTSPPPGLKRALAHMGETAWAAEDYRTLLGLLDCPVRAKTVRHAALIDPNLIRGLVALPDVLIRAGVGARFALSHAQTLILVDAGQAVMGNRPTEEAALEFSRWAGATSAKSLFKTVGESLMPEIPVPPFAGSDRLRHLSSKAAMRDAAVRFRNCLRGKISHASSGESVFYEWVGPPGAVVEIWRDPIYGWRLDEARLARNQYPPQPVRDEINAELRTWGVHVGRSSWQLTDLVGVAASPTFVYESAEDAVGACYGD